MRRTQNVGIGAACLVLAAASASHGSIIRKADNATALNVASSWSTGTVPTGANDVVFDNLLATPANTTIPVGNANVTMHALSVVDPAGPIQLNSSGTSSLISFAVAGAFTTPGGLDLSSATQDLTFNTNVRFAYNTATFPGAFTFNVATGRKATFGLPATTFTFNIAGGGTKAITVTGDGDLIFNSRVTTATGNAANLTKTGSGKLIFNSSAALTATTTTSAINGGSVIASTGAVVTLSNAFSINNTATLAGLGTFATNTSISLNAGGIISPGIDSTQGTLSLTPGSTSTVSLVAAVTPTASSSLHFDLGGLIQDRLNLTQGSLAIGTDVLEFDDFLFTTTGGISEGTYTLISTPNPISGTLGINLSGPVGLDHTGTLGLSADGRSIELVVAIPEPTTAIVLVGLMGIMSARRRDRT